MCERERERGSNVIRWFLHLSANECAFMRWRRCELVNRCVFVCERARERERVRVCVRERERV